MDTSPHLYSILGLSSDATAEDIRDAYRLMARRFHPDVNRNEGAALQFRDIAAAYDVLGDDFKRREYDARRRLAKDDASFFSLRVIPSKRVLATLSEPQVLYLLVEIVPVRQAKRLHRQTPLNLVLVLDRSTSMRGVRLDKVKIAAHEIIEQLTPKDILSVVSFSDFADVLIEAAPVTNRQSLQSIVSIMRADGGTEILQGLQAGVEQCRKHLGRHMVNHVILLTDGRTFGDEVACLELAAEAASEGIGISAMGIGEEWNDSFLDELAARTGGTSAYITSPAAVTQFLNERVRALGDSFVERLMVSIAPDADITMESVFKLLPTPQPLNASPQPIPIGNLEHDRSCSVLVQLQMPPTSREGFRTVVRLDVTGDVLLEGRIGHKVISDFSVELAHEPRAEEPPRPVMDALGKLTLYRMQQKAEQAALLGNPADASRRLENLATRLLAAGQDSLAQMALAEAQRVTKTSMLSEQGRKTLKFGTRMLLALPQPGEGKP